MKKSLSIGPALILALLLAHAGLVSAQDYKEIREDAQGPITENRLLRTRIGGVLRNGQFSAPDDEATFNEFFRWRINSLTWNELRSQLPDIRREIKRQWLKFAGDAPSQDLHNRLNDLLLEKCTEFATSDEYHPVVRVNAMLIIGMLDKKEPDIRGLNNEPLDKAFPVLISALRNEALHEAVRVEALTGLEYHAGLKNAQPGASSTATPGANFPDERRRALVDALVAILSQTEPPEGTSLDGHLWLRYRSADILAQIGGKWAETNTPQVAKALYSLAADKSAPFSMRIRAAYALGTIDANGLKGSGVAPRDMALTLGELAGQVGQAPGATVDHLQYYLRSLDKGLNGVAPGRGVKVAATESDSAIVTEVGARTKSLIDTLTRRGEPDNSKLSKVRSLAADLHAWVEQQAPPAAESPSGSNEPVASATTQTP